MPNTRLHFLIFPIYAVLLVKEMEFFSLFLLLGEIRRVLSGKMATNQLKISQKIDIDSFQCIDWHREVIKVTLCVNFMTNRHLNSNTKHCASPCPPVPSDLDTNAYLKGTRGHQLCFLMKGFDLQKGLLVTNNN